MTILAGILRALAVSEYTRKMAVVYTGMVKAVSPEDGGATSRITDRGQEFVAGFDKLKKSLNNAENQPVADLFPART